MPGQAASPRAGGHRGRWGSPTNVVVGGRIGATSTSVATSYSQETYSNFAFPMQHLQEFAWSVTNILYNFSAKVKLRCPLLWMWSLGLTEALRQPVIYSASSSALLFCSGLSRSRWSTMTSCPASSQSLPVPGVSPCVLKHRAALSHQILISFPLSSTNACGRQVFGMGIGNHRQRGIAAAAARRGSAVQCLHTWLRWSLGR